MPDPITWYALGRNIGDPTLIEEEMDAKILAHNLDASAHGQSDEAVYNHRISELLDHVNYSIYNIKLHPETRPIKAFVDIGGASEFADIQEAINYVHALGGGKIFIKAGTYPQNGSITMYSDVYLEGDDDDTTIIDFQGGNYGLRSVGTIDLLVRNIHITHLQFTGSNNHYEGAVYFEFTEDSSVQNCQFKDNYIPAGNASCGVGLYNCDRILIENNKFDTNYTDILVVYGNDNIVRFNRCTNAQSDSILYSQTNLLQCLFNIITSCIGGGILCEDTPDDALIQGNRITDFGWRAISLSEPNRVQILDNHILAIQECDAGIGIGGGGACIIANNYLSGKAGAWGIYLDQPLQDIISNNYLTVWTNGIELTAGSSRNLVHGNHIYQNVTNKIIDGGTLTTLADNLTA